MSFAIPRWRKDGRKEEEEEGMEQEWDDEWICLVCGIHRKMAMTTGNFAPFCVYCRPYVERYMQESGKPVDLLGDDDFVAIARMRLAAFLGA